MQVLWKRNWGCHYRISIQDFDLAQVRSSSMGWVGSWNTMVRSIAYSHSESRCPQSLDVNIIQDSSSSSKRASSVAAATSVF